MSKAAYVHWSVQGLQFSAFHLLKEIKQTGLGIQLSSGKTVGRMLFAGDFVGISDSKESLIDVVYTVKPLMLASIIFSVFTYTTF